MKLNIECVRDILKFVIENQDMDENLRLQKIPVCNLHSSPQLNKYESKTIQYALL